MYRNNCLKSAAVEKTVSEHRRPKHRRRKLEPVREQGSPCVGGEAAAREARTVGGDDDEGTTSTRSGSPSTAAGAAQMLQLAVGRSPVRARRPAQTQGPGRLTDASLAAFDLAPDLDDTATATAVNVQPAGLLDAADFSLPPFDLQT